MMPIPRQQVAKKCSTFASGRKNVMDDKVDDKAPQWHGQQGKHSVTHSERQVCNFMAYGTGPWFMLQHCATHHGGCVIIPKGLCQMGISCINWQESGKNDGLAKFPAMLYRKWEKNCLHQVVTSDEELGYHFTPISKQSIMESKHST
jgi:hypothetical protein